MQSRILSHCTEKSKAGICRRKINMNLTTTAVFTLMLASCCLCDLQVNRKRQPGCGCTTRICMYNCVSGKRTMDMQELYEKKNALPFLREFSNEQDESGPFKNRFYQYLTAKRGNAYSEVGVKSDY
ncbi:uncharacterized protein LOC117123605 [Anneissia japonica]|uniref:uncharacterized protein LOC117123605 n=1 Tax=Anneissia japonica TaxID=1529436 RepID=UPI0014259E36|nr:uncharacterized protein LOC117123605 [Anneissia japonica]